MRRYLYLLSIIVFTFCTLSNAQPLGIRTGLNLKNAYKEGTRSIDGAPGANYWQNQSEYKINVELIPEKNEVIGDENITYYNNSSDTLKTLVLRLYPDLFKKGAVRDYPVDTIDVTSGVEIKEFKVMNTSPKFERNGTNLIVKLESPIPPNSTTALKVVWKFTLPTKSKLRMGAYSATAFMVGYWYPQIAVYDDISGWDMLNYTGTVEFYNDFSNYEVSVTVPKDFMVWATGTLTNAQDIFTKTINDRLNRAHQGEEIVQIISEADSVSSKVFLTPGKNSFKFKAINVPDFAFSAAKGYYWDAASLICDKEYDKRTLVQAAYNPKSKDFYEVCDIAKKSLKYFSYDMPGVPYPYPSMTVFNGSGGMEFPMIVNDGSSQKRIGTVHVTSHEIAHTYFPFYMGINERKYPFMDEGWATMLPLKFQSENVQGYNPLLTLAQSFSEFSGSEKEVPVITPAFMVGDYMSYRNNAYVRPGLAYYFFMDMVGEAKFKDALHKYIKRWYGKHPLPNDFFLSFNNALGKNYDWYWNAWFTRFDTPDLAITKTEKLSDQEYAVTVSNKGGLPLPIKLTPVYKESQKGSSLYLPADVWSTSEKNIVVNLKVDKGVIGIVLGGDTIPDVCKEDNSAVIN